MITVSDHCFGDPDDPNGISISIAEVIEEEYGLHVWPCSIALAEYVWQQKDRFLSSKVLELGAGTGLPGILAAKVGALVTLTDLPDRPKFQALTWADWESVSLNLNPDIILGADLLYNPRDFDDLFATVAFMLHNHAGAVFIAAYEPRSGHRSIEFLMAKWRLECTKLLDAHSILPEAKLSSISTSIEIVEIQAAEALC